MTLKRRLALWLAVALACVAVTAVAQSGEKYKIRLSSVPALTSRGAGMTVTAASVVGSGNASATLSGKKLTVTGSFEKLASVATEVNLYQGPAMGARNYGSPALLKLTLMKAADGKSGSFTGTFDLTADQVDAVKTGKINIQLLSEGSPTGHLVGWFVKDTGK